MKKTFLFLLCCLLTVPAFAEIEKISVIGSLNTPFNNAYTKAASQLAASLAGQKKHILCIGTGIGPAGALLKTLANRDAEYTAVSHQDKDEKNCPKNHPCQTITITKLANLENQTKLLLTQADAIVFLPGGFDVMYAFNYFEALVQNKHESYKPVVFLNTNHFWDRMNEMLIEMRRQNILPKEVMQTISFENQPNNVFKTILKLQKNIDNIEKKK